MNENDFARRWAELYLGNSRRSVLVKTIQSRLDEVGLSAENKQFLLEVGLPAQAWLFDLDSVPTLPRVYEKWNVGRWSEHELQAVRSFLVLGYSQGGDPLCVHEPSGRVVVLNHEAAFCEAELVNSSIPFFAECLLLSASAAHERIDYHESLEAMQRLDPAAMGANSFWDGNYRDLIEDILEDRQDNA